MKKINFNKKFSIVLGGSGHIGLATTECLLEHGSHVLVIDKNLKSIPQSIKRKYKSKLFLLETDITNNDDLEIIDKFLNSKKKHIDILINSVALVGSSKLKGWNEDFKKQKKESWDKAIETNLTSVFFLIQRLAKYYKKNKSTSIINISSIYGLYPPKLGIYKNTEIHNPAAYSVSKAGINYMTKWLAVHLAPNVRVNTISPGGIIRNQSKTFIKQYASQTLMNRMATENDLIGAIIFLASDMSLYVTGQNIVIDGGWSIK